MTRSGGMSCGVSEADDLGHLIVLQLRAGREDDQLAQQTEREDLKSEHDQQRRLSQCGPVGQRCSKPRRWITSTSIHSTPALRWSNHHAEEPQRPLVKRTRKTP